MGIIDKIKIFINKVINNMSKQDEMVSILNEAFDEGVASTESAIQQASEEGYNRGYQEGYSDALSTLPIVPPSDEDDDGIPVHNIDNFAVKEFFDSLPESGYSKSDYSKVWKYLFMTQDHSSASWTECCNPYVIYGKGDKIVVESEGETSWEVFPYKEVFRIFSLIPNKQYHWTMYNGTKVLQSGDFKTVGRVRWMGTFSSKEPRNFRDLGGYGIKYGRLYRSENPDSVEVESADHKYLRDQLKITVQVNLRSSSEPARADLFEKTYQYNIPAYSEVFTCSSTSKANFKNAFNAIVNELSNGKNVLFNCWQGCDRTGTMAWMIQGLCGMPLGYCEGHWELSGLDRCGNSKIWNWEESSNGELRTFITKLQAKIKDTSKRNDSYTLAYYLAKTILGITDGKINKLRELLLE